jgi:hypothetical protein
MMDVIVSGAEGLKRTNSTCTVADPSAIVAAVDV